jgi:UDP-glucose 4-epimerase
MVHNDMSVLVTGARGGIGRHVVAAAQARGEHVNGLGHGAWTGDSALPAINAWVNGDVTLDNLDMLAEESGAPDIIIHLAGGSHVGASIERPAEDFRRSVAGAQNLVEWIRTRVPSAKLVVASSAAVYGNTADSPIPETAAYAPTSPYGTHKAMVEMLACAYARQYGLSAAIVRLFSVYGPGLRKQLVYELFQRLRRGEREIRLGGTGAEARDFLFIADAAQMLLDAVEHADAAVPTYNGASGVAVTVAALAEAMAAHFDGVKLEFSGAARKGDPINLVGDVNRAQKAGLYAKTPLATGLAQTLQWIAHDDGAI